MFYFEQLPVCKLSEECYKLIMQYCLKNYAVCPEHRSQLRRAGSSIVLNVAEGMGKIHKKDKSNFFAIARGSTHESVSIVKLIYLENHITSDVFNQIYNKLDSISRMLSALIKSLSTK